MSYNDKNMFCPWCQLPTFNAAPQYSLCVHLLELEDLGWGVPLYFYFQKYLLFVYLTMVLIVSIPATIIYSRENKAKQWKDTDDALWPIDLTLGNYGTDDNRYEDSSLNTVIILGIVTIVILYIMNFFFQNFQINIVNKIDEVNVTPGDFTVTVSSLPRDKNKEQIHNWMSSRLDNLEIKEINLAYDISTVVAKIRKLDKLKQIKNNYELHKTKYKYEDLQRDIKNLQQEVDQIKRDIDNHEAKLDYMGRAFVTFDKQSQAERVIWLFQRHWTIRVYFALFKNWRWTNKCKDKRWWDNKFVQVDRSAEPTDIFWENMALSFKSKLRYKTITYLSTVILLAIVFWITLILNLIIDELEDEEEDRDSNSFRALIRIINLAQSIFVAVINIVLRQLLRILTSKERDDTYTYYNLGYSFKVLLAMFANTALIPLFSHLNEENWFESGGLVDNIFLNVLVINFVSPIFYYFNFTYFYKWLMIYFTKRKGKDSKMTQRQANKLYEGKALDIAKSYADLLVILCTTAFYTPLIPILPVFSFFGLIYQYWLQKYILLRKWKIPESIGEILALRVGSGMPLYMIWYTWGQYIFVNSLSNGQNQLCLPIMIVSIIYWLTPKEYLLHKCQTSIKRDDAETFTKSKYQFLTDYDRSNPLTSKEATLRYLHELELREDNKDESDKIRDRIRKLRITSIFDSLQNYGQQRSLEQRVQRIFGVSKENNTTKVRSELVSKFFMKAKGNQVSPIQALFSSNNNEDRIAEILQNRRLESSPGRVTLPPINHTQ